MKETALWQKIKVPLNRFGMFQKISDRFTPGVPDALGSYVKRAWALELKEFKGVHKIKVHFRPGQLDWLRDWDEAGGVALVVATHGLRVFTFRHIHGPSLEEGLTVAEAEELADFIKEKTDDYRDFCKRVLIFYNKHY